MNATVIIKECSRGRTPSPRLSSTCSSLSAKGPHRERYRRLAMDQLIIEKVPGTHSKPLGSISIFKLTQVRQTAIKFSAWSRYH